MHSGWIWSSKAQVPTELVPLPPGRAGDKSDAEVSKYQVQCCLALFAAICRSHGVEASHWLCDSGPDSSHRAWISVTARCWPHPIDRKREKSV